MKHAVKFFLASLLMMTIMVSPVTSYAFTEDAPSPLWSYLTMISANMEVSDNNAATIYVTCDSDGWSTNKVIAKCELQQLNGSWKTIKTWTESNNNSYIMYTKNYAIAKKYSYRLKVTASTYKDSKLLETVTEYFDYGYYQ